MKIPNPNQLLKQSGSLLNQVICFFAGLFFSAIFFTVILKIFNGTGIFIGLIAGYALNFWLKRKYRQHPILNSINNGILTFNILTSVIGLILFFFVSAALQGIIS